jgi:hypothetical protein
LKNFAKLLAIPMFTRKWLSMSSQFVNKQRRQK